LNKTLCLKKLEIQFSNQFKKYKNELVKFYLEIKVNNAKLRKLLNKSNEGSTQEKPFTEQNSL